jgi:hypothetical protein
MGFGLDDLAQAADTVMVVRMGERSEDSASTGLPTAWPSWVAAQTTEPPSSPVRFPIDAPRTCTVVGYSGRMP